MIEWLIGDPEPERVARQFYGNDIYEALVRAEREERERRRLVRSGEFIDEAWPQLQPRDAATCSGVGLK